MKTKLFLTTCLILILSINKGRSQGLTDTLVEIEQVIVHFASDKSDLLPLDTLSINLFLDNHSINNAHQIDIGSHTDDVGSNNYNINLSKSRSETIVNYLIKKGISTEKLSYNNYGETIPIVNGYSKDDRRKNRRSVVRLFKKNKIILLKGEVRDERNNLISGASVSLESKLISINTKTDEHGQFEIPTPYNQDYNISVIAKNYFFTTSDFKRNKALERSNLEIVLPKIEVGKKFVIKKIHFWGNRCNMLSDGLSELERLRETMKINDQMCIEISGHVNIPNAPKEKVGSKNFNLSVARALAVLDSLVEVNIDPRRILAKGYGNWEMVFPRAINDKQQQMNRRVEIQILDCKFIGNSNSDQIDDYESFDIKPLKIKYSKFHFIDHLDLFSNLNKKKILTSLKHLKSKEINPTHYTYGQLLSLSSKL